MTAEQDAPTPSVSRSPADPTATRVALEDLQRLHVSLLLQIDHFDQDVRRLRWWTLTIAILLLVLTILWRVA